jgi:hypothetical protein
MYIFWSNFTPELPQSAFHRLKIGLTAVALYFHKGLLVFPVNDEDALSDYFVLRNKPRIFSLFIDRPFQVVLQEKVGRIKVLAYGFHFLKKEEGVLSIINLQPDMISIGPHPESRPFQTRNSISDLVKSHHANIRFKQTLAKTSNGNNCVASLHVYYKVRGESLANALDHFEHKKRLDTFLYQSFNRQFEKELENTISDLWRKTISSKSIADLKSPAFSGSFSLDELITDLKIFHSYPAENGPLSNGDLDQDISLISKIANIDIVVKQVWFDKEVKLG